MVRKTILLALLIMIISMVVPIFDAISYDYEHAENELQKIMDDYARTNYQSDVSIMSYRQSTGGLCWTIKYSTNKENIGTVIPIWLINPIHLQNEGNYGDNTFLYREIIVLTKKDAIMRKVYYDGESVSVIIPQRIIVAMPQNEYVPLRKTYKVYDLSAIGMVLLYSKICLCICIILVIAKKIRLCCTHRRTVRDH